MSYIDTILNTLMWLLGSGAIGLLAFFLYKEMQYKHRAIIKRVNNNIKYTYIDKFKVKKDTKTGIETWVLKKNKTTIPPAPNECIEVDTKGRFMVQYYQLDGGEIIPAKDGFDLEDEESKQEIITKIQPFTFSQRQIMVNQYEKSQLNKKKGIGEWLMNAAPMLVVVMILVIFMIFFADVVEPTQELASQLTSATESMENTLGRLENIVHDRITIEDYEEVNPGNFTPPN